MTVIYDAMEYTAKQVEAPRMWTQGADVLLERTFPDTVFDELKGMGNDHTSSATTAAQPTNQPYLPRPIIAVCAYYAVIDSRYRMIMSLSVGALQVTPSAKRSRPLAVE